MVADRIRHCHAAAHLFIDVVQNTPEDRVDDLPPQQIYRLHQRHPGLEERREFLVEDEKLVMGDLSPLREEAATGERCSLSERKDVQTLRFEIMAQARFVLSRVGSFDDLPRGGHQPTAKFHPKWLKL